MVTLVVQDTLPRPKERGPTRTTRVIPVSCPTRPGSTARVLPRHSLLGHLRIQRRAFLPSRYAITLLAHALVRITLARTTTWLVPLLNRNFEVQVQYKDGARHSYASQSLQVAPFDDAYAWGNSSADATIYDDTITEFNTYTGGQIQESRFVRNSRSDRGFNLTTNDYVRYGV